MSTWGWPITHPAGADADDYLVFNGSAWVAQPLAITWTAYTPALTASSSNPTLGSASSATGRYVQLGDVVHVMLDISFGSSGVAAGSGTYRVSLPVTRSNSSLMGVGQLIDNSTGTRNIVVAIDGTSTTDQTEMSVHGATGNVTNSAPWTWAASDRIRLNLTYEAA